MVGGIENDHQQHEVMCMFLVFLMHVWPGSCMKQEWVVSKNDIGGSYQLIDLRSLNLGSVSFNP